MVQLKLLAFAPLALAVPFSKRAPQNLNLQGHRGSRGETVEQTMPAWARAFEDGVDTMEGDFGITKDDIAVIWHDEDIQTTKCLDTKPVTADDPLFPYVGKYIANLTLAQIKTLDCGSQHLTGFPLALTSPGTKIQTLTQFFEFTNCVDVSRRLHYNLETKIDPAFPNLTKGPEIFVEKGVEVFKKSGNWKRITHQSFDWRALVYSKQKYSDLTTVALFDDTTIDPQGYPRAEDLPIPGDVSPWLANLKIEDFPGDEPSAQVVYAAQSIGASIISPSYRAYNSGDQSTNDIGEPGFVPFINSTMVNTAHELGLYVIPWTVNGIKNVEWLVDDLGVDGIITDYPGSIARWLKQQEIKTPKPWAQERIDYCLKKYNYGRQ
ncbi:PLC-like phosphodiesterase [Atractiella rhizophila]|nr:PLC-like phosphodiesterase [Atractiella rhizophila]